MVEQSPDRMNGPAILGVGGMMLLVFLLCVVVGVRIWEGEHGGFRAPHGSIDPARAAPVHVALFDAPPAPLRQPPTRFEWVDPDQRTVTLPVDVASDLVARQW